MYRHREREQEGDRESCVDTEKENKREIERVV